METNAEIIRKLKIIFESFLQENFRTTNSVSFEKLLTHLAYKENEYILQEPFSLEWVERCITIISEDFDKLNHKVVSFMLHFCSLLTMNEWVIIDIREHKFVDRIISILDRDLERFNPSMKLGIIRFFSAISKYSLGLAYMRSTKIWRFLINFCNKDHTLYVVREARQLLYELLYKFSVKTNNEHICQEILNEIIKPIHENVFDERTSSDSMTISVDDSDLQQKLSPTLDLISFILQKTLESEEKTSIAYICDIDHKLDVILWKLCQMTQAEFFLQKILAALSSFNFAKLVYEKWHSGEISAENFNKFGVNFFNHMKFCVSRRECINFLKLAELNHILWKKLGQRAPKEIQIENERVQFENQLITFHLLPVLFVHKSIVHHHEELFDKYIMKLFAISCEYTLRICYTYRDILFNAQVQLSADLACKSIHGILSMENILDRDQAVLVFQAMIYALKEFTLETLSKTDDCDSGAVGNHTNNNIENGRHLIVEIPNVLYAALVGLQTLIHRYKITWKESIETICLVNFVAELLENPNMSSRLAVQALKLAQLSIEHFLAPNMALLVDNLQGSALLRLGPILIKRFHDNAWEVRDSALELATSIANISRIKFPAFQQFIVDHKICPVIYEMAKNDGEPYVRASAYNCLSQMVSISLVWENELSNFNITEHLFSVLCNESEGIVRKEAVSALIKISDHGKIPNKYNDILYSTFCYCVVADLHWEVKVTALQFWELEIQRQFTNQGMIDGTFPSVTFSKENKKIVTLTEKEIKLRIKKIFNELSVRGCLGVILNCLQDDCDLEVIKTSVCLVKRLLKKLEQYDYETIIDDMDSDSNHSYLNINDPSATFTPVPDIDMQSDTNSIEERDSDAVIESILSSQDINLLISTYERKLQMSNEELVANIDKDYYKKYSQTSAKEFVATIKSIDLDKLLHNHNRWFLCSDSFTSLLDDLQCAIKPDERIIADCY